MIKKTLAILFTGLLSVSAYGAKITIDVQSLDNEPLRGAVVSFLGNSTAQNKAPLQTQIMDQVDRQFKPHILAVRKGAPVSFPNSDSIKHHVYSFSSAKVFELQLYRGSKADPVIFNKAGIVELGCNVHDWMLGYIYVVDSPFFGQTDENSQVSIELPEGEYEVKVWHPRLQDADVATTTKITVTGNQTIPIKLTQSLLADQSDLEGEIDEFSIYE